jgi:hypothetical protein
MHPDLGNFVFNGMNYIVQLQKHIHGYDPVMKRSQFVELFHHIFYKFAVCVKMDRLNGNVHSIAIYQ